MIQEIKVENFRGIERLEMKGLRRVNLITGKNDCGKTTVLEALRAAWFGSIVDTQVSRKPKAAKADFDGYWRPIFRNGDVESGLGIELSKDGQSTRFSVRKGKRSAKLTEQNIALNTRDTGWTLIEQSEGGGVSRESLIVSRNSNEVEVTNTNQTDVPNESLVWIYGRPALSQFDLKLFSQLKQAGRDIQVVELLRHINDDIQGVELLAPTGSGAELFVRLSARMPMLPMAMLGEGTQRCFEIALALATEVIEVICLDEIENGLHHSTIEKLWRWVATVSAERNVQIFATTHSEECIQAAAHAFTELNDDGLCVVRLDRHAHETTAALYDKSLVEATERMGIEIRG